MKTLNERWETIKNGSPGDGHIKPSPETLQMVGQLNTKIEIYATKMEAIEKKVDDGFTRMEKRFETHEKKHDEMMQAFKELINQKANKWTENVLIWFGTIVGAGVIGVIGWVILDNIKSLK